jgi:hypothetical protein
VDILKEKMVTSPILVFLDWSKEFHVHVDASSITLGAILTQLGEGDIDHPIAIASHNRIIIQQKNKVCIWCMHCISSNIIC